MPDKPILDHLWIIPLLPLLGSAINGLLGWKWPKNLVNWVALGSTGLSFLCALEAIRGGQPLRLETLHAHDEFGWTAVLNRKRQLQARALEPVRVMAFEVSQVREACRSNPYFGAAFLERLFTIAVEQLQSTRLRLVKALAEPKTS